MEQPKRYRRVKKGGNKLTHYHLSELTERFLKGMDQSGGRELDQINLIWSDLVGVPIASKSKLVRFQEKVLHVAVSHSTVLSVLQCSEKTRLLRILQKRFPKINIRDISFRIG